MYGAVQMERQAGNEHEVERRSKEAFEVAGPTDGDQPGGSVGDHRQGEGATGENLLTKTCATCLECLPLCRFSTNRPGSISRRKHCNSCMNTKMKSYKQRWEEENKEEIFHRRKNYREEHREEIREKKREDNKKHPEKQKIRMQRYLEKNGDLEKEKKKQYQINHADEIRETKHKYYVLNAETIKAKVRLYRKKHPEKYKEWCRISRQIRRAREKGIVSDLTEAQWAFICNIFEHRCAYCPPSCRQCQRKMHKLAMDHITPVSKNGDTTAINIVPACKSCNSKKFTGPPLKPVQPILPLGFDNDKARKLQILTNAS